MTAQPALLTRGKSPFRHEPSVKTKDPSGTTKMPPPHPQDLHAQLSSQTGLATRRLMSAKSPWLKSSSKGGPM
eukprot:2123334-Pyramimonas_sp.AAC.1